MDVPLDAQDVSAYLQQLGDGDASIEIGMRNVGGTREAYAIVFDTLGGQTSITSELSAPSVDHTLRLEVSGNTYTLYVDDVSVGSNSPATGSLANVGFIRVREIPVGAGTDMSISFLDIYNSEAGDEGPVEAGRPLDGRWRNRQIYVAKYQGEYYEFHDSKEFEEFVQNKMAEEIAAGDVPDEAEVKPWPPKAKIPGWVRRALRKKNAD